ncbi:hypothetical protein [Sphingobacterium chuzhouense]|uniref:Uncharacterized protein n=1 Tax=Sphingobacterium chuzhouense TaxID=1742264 RepID=A0ABR7XPY0_9SPHI|nr:hypothetical protein [Sphingobacterium chuzhouense]MBD1421221.1 hypothetical protein [Sphingobacterium chuzhouense]
MQAHLEFKEIQITAMPQIEVEKMLNVLVLRKRKRYSQFELSFLMGQRDFYVRDVEDLAHTLIYTIPFNNIFRQIFNCGIQAIVPDVNQKPSYKIRISEATDENDAVSYHAERQFEDGTIEFIATFGTEEKDWQLEFAEPTYVVSEERVQDWVLDKIESDYFDVAKNALQIFNDCTAELTGAVRPLFLVNALKACNGTKGLPKLNKKKDRNGRFVYIKEKIKL